MWHNPVRPKRTAVAFRVRHCERLKRIKDVNLTAKAGRVLGIYGLVGSGRTEFLRALIGMEALEGGTIEVFGRPYRPRNPATSRGCWHCLPDRRRQRDGIIAALNSNINVALPVLRRYCRRGFLRSKIMERSTNEYLDLLKVRGDRSQPITRLWWQPTEDTVHGGRLTQQTKIAVA